MRIRLICLAKVLCFLPSLLAISRSEMTPSCTQIINILSASASNSRSRPITREQLFFRTVDTRKRKSFPDRIGQNGTILEDRKKPKMRSILGFGQIGTKLDVQKTYRKGVRIWKWRLANLQTSIQSHWKSLWRRCVYIRSVDQYSWSSFQYDMQPDTLRKYYNGRRSIAPLAKRVLPFIEPTCFSVYLERKCSDATAANIAADLEDTAWSADRMNCLTTWQICSIKFYGVVRTEIRTMRS